MSIVITDLVTAFGAHYKAGSQNERSLYQRLHRPSVTAGYFRTIPTTSTRLELGSSDLDRALQAFQKNFTPTGTVTFKPNPIDLFRFKIDKRETPDDLVHSWAGFLTGENIDRKSWPFVRWLLEVHLFPKAEEEFELDESYKGVYAAPTTDVVPASGTAMNGIEQQLADHSAETNLITLGAAPVDPADYCEYVETFAAEMGKEDRKKVDFIFMNEDNELKYKQGKRKKYNMYYGQEENLMTIADFPNIKVAGLPGMEGKNKLWSTRPENRIRPIKMAPMGRPIIGEYSPRQVSIFTDWHEVLTFAHWASLWESDQT